MTAFQTWVLIRTFLRSRYAYFKVDTPRHAFYPRLDDAVAILNTALGYADGGASYGFSISNAWRVCRRLAMRFVTYVPQPMRSHQTVCHFRFRDAIAVPGPVLSPFWTKKSVRQ